MEEKDRLQQQLARMRDNWQQIQESIEGMYLYWQGDGAESYKRLYETGVKQPLLRWMEEMEDEAEGFFREK